MDEPFFPFTTLKMVKLFSNKCMVSIAFVQMDVPLVSYSSFMTFFMRSLPHWLWVSASFLYLPNNFFILIFVEEMIVGDWVFQSAALGAVLYDFSFSMLTTSLM